VALVAVVLMLRAAAPIYARVLLCSGVSRAHRTRSVADTLWANGPLIKMQRRTRSSDAAAAPADTLKSPRRPSRKAQQITIKEEVHESEHISPSVAATRRSARVKIKSEIVVQTKLSEEAEEADEDKLDEPDDEDSHAPTAPKKKRRLRVVKRGADGKPDHWEDVLRGIQEMRASQIAAVDVAGIEAMFDDGDGKFEPHVARFHMLISAMLSSQTKDPVNAAAMERLIAHGLTVAEMLAIDEKLLKELIYPVGFYNNKVRYIKQVAQILTDRAAEAGDKVVDIPDTFEALVALPGVGPKMAHLVMSCAWDK
jgi:endonuclease III